MTKTSIQWARSSTLPESAHRFLDDAESLRRLNAFTQIRRDLVMDEVLRAEGSQVSGPVAGDLYVAKDIIDVAGYATTGGTPALAELIVERDAPVIVRLRSAGAILVGKTNLHELSFGITSNNAHFGAVANPYDATRIAGGSSGGSAVAVATGLVRFALAADTGGSARIPAALCGVVGFRPTAGRYPMQGVLPISPTRDTVGVIANTANDVVEVDAVLSATRPNRNRIDLRGYRIGRISSFVGALDPSVQGAYAAALAALEGVGADLVDVDLTRLFEVANRIGLPVALYEFPTAIRTYLQNSGVALSAEQIGAAIASEDVRDIWAAATSPGIDRDSYLEAMAERDALITEYRQLLDEANISVVVYPTTPVTARPIGEDDTIAIGSDRVGTFATYTRFTNLGGVVGHPSITLPVGFDELGLPIGVEMAARRDHDADLLQIAVAAGEAFSRLRAETFSHSDNRQERSQ